MAEQRSAHGQDPVNFLKRHFAGRRVSSNIGIRAEARPARFAEQAYFDLHLIKDDSTSVDPLFSGLFSAGRVSQNIQGWVDGDYFDELSFSASPTFSLSDAGLEVPFFRILGELVPPGGSLMVSYTMFSKESRLHKETRLGLDRGYPPVVTPIGFLLFMAGCGMGFKDWYFAEGGREGPEKLQGYKPISPEAAKVKAKFMFQELSEFSNLPHNDEDALARTCRSRADNLLQELKNQIQ